MKKIYKIPVRVFYYLYLLFSLSIANASEIESILIKGNERISNETIILFSDINVDSTSNKNLNQVIKNLYQTNFLKMLK